MIQLLINNQPVVVNDLKLEIVKQNPLFTEENDHTLDITVPMTNANNQKVFSFKSRFDLTNKTDKEYYAKIIDNGSIVIEGKLYILEVSDNNIKVQIVVENKFFRYSGPDDTRNRGGERIDELLKYYRLEPEGQVPRDTPNVRKYKSFPMNVYIKYDNYVIDPLTPEDPIPPIINKNGPYTPYPFLLYVIEALFNIMGLVIKTNFLRSEKIDIMNRMIIVTNYQQSTVGEHLPAWTVAKFVTEVEKLFNCEVRFNPDQVGDIDIISRRIYTDRIIDIDAYDDYDVEIIDEDEGLNLYDNVRYNFPTDIMYFREADLDDKQNEAIKVQSVPYLSIPENVPTQPKRFSYGVGSNGIDRQFCRYDGEGYYNAFLTAVNSYAHIGQYDASNVIELNILPCAHTCFYPRDFQQDYKYIPMAIGNLYSKPEIVKQDTSLSIVKDGAQGIPNNNDDKMYIAFWGITESRWGHSGINVPFAINNYKNSPDYLMPQNEPTESNYNSSMSLQFLKKEFWIGEEIDNTCVYKVKATIPYYDNIQNIKVRIKNKLFVVKTIKYEYTMDGISSVAQLELYPLKEQS